MRIEYDRDTCIGMFQCVVEWDAFEKDESAGKAVLAGSEPKGRTSSDSSDGSEETDLFVRDVPKDAELDAKFAARACPVDAIRVYDDGEQIIP